MRLIEGEAVKLDVVFLCTNGHCPILAKRGFLNRVKPRKYFDVHRCEGCGELMTRRLIKKKLPGAKKK